MLWEQWNRLARVTVTPRTPGLDEALAIMRADHEVSDADAERLVGMWRLGWGASDRYTGVVPPMMWIQLDADAGTPIIEGGVDADLGFLEWDVTSVGHHLRRDRMARAFVIGGGGGRDVLTALHFGAQSVDVVEINPSVVEVVRHGFPAFVGAPAYDDPRVHLTIGEGRSALARSDGRYDLIQMSLVDTWAASMAGAMVLSENTLYTKEAFEAYVSHLGDRGVLTVSRWYDPAAWGETARVIRLAAEALRHEGIANPEDHLVVLYSRGFLQTGVANVVASRAPIDAADLAVIDELVARQGFGVLWPRTAATVDHGWDVGAVIRGAPAVIDDPRWDLSLPSDERPFFFNTRRPFSSWVEAFRQGDASLGSRSTALFVAATLLLGGVGLLLVTRPLRELGGKASIPVLPAVYFGGIGVGFMAIEMGMIQRYIVFLGHPTYALSVVLFALLLGSGVGSALSDRLGTRHVVGVIGAVIGFIGLTAFLLPAVLDGALLWPLGARVALAVSSILPPALFLGMVWPLGVRSLKERGLGEQVPWMWAVNGFCGVLASVVAVFVATAFGYTAVLGLAVAAYALTAATTARPWSPPAENRRWKPTRRGCQARVSPEARSPRPHGAS